MALEVSNDHSIAYNVLYNACYSLQQTRISFSQDFSWVDKKLSRVNIIRLRLSSAISVIVTTSCRPDWCITSTRINWRRIIIVTSSLRLRSRSCPRILIGYCHFTVLSYDLCL